MISAQSLITAILVGTLAVEGFAPKSIVSSSTTRLFAEDDPLPLPPWKGGFKDSNPDFKYDQVKPDLSSIPMTKNLDNMDKITRMQKIRYPEFSWFQKIGDPASRVYTVFAQDVSRIGYDDDGRIWSLVCPQRAVPIPYLGCAFVEVTVTGVRGWVDEENMSVYADVSVEGNVWIEPAHGNPLIKVLTKIFKAIDPLGEFPFNKANAVKVEAHQVGKPYKAEWPMVNGTDPDIFQPMNRRHYDDGAYSAYNLEVEMGSKIKNKQSSLTDRFDDLVLELFNLHSSGILLPGQRVSWNLWPTAPEGVEIEEWEGHAEKWFNSMNIKHEYPDGTKLSDRLITTYDGTEIDSEFDREGSLALLKEFLLDIMNSGPTAAAELANDPLIDFVMNYLGEKRTTDYLK